MRASRRATLVLLCLGLSATPAAASTFDPPDPGSTKTFTYGSGSSAYPYIVYVPTSYDRSERAPLIVMTHGCQTTADEQMRANLYNQVAEREGVVMLYPDVTAAEVAQPGPLARCWQFFNQESWHRDSGDAAAIAGMTRAVKKRWRIDPDRVYMVGMSAGSFMTSIMAAAYPDLYAAVAIMAGGAYADSGCLIVGPGIPAAQSAQLAYDEMGSRARIVPRLVMGGDADQGIPPTCADKALEQGLRTNNLVLGDRQDAPIALTPASVHEVPKAGGYSSTVSTYLDPDGCMIGKRWLIHGMNHFWSGGSADPSLANFTDPKGPNGAEATWRFLSRYTKSTTGMPCAEARRPALRCRAQWLKLRTPPGARSPRARVNGDRARIRLSHRHVRVRLPSARRSRTVVVIRGRTRAGEHFTRRHSYPGCGRELVGEMSREQILGMAHDH
jgi:poly(hydroxyalkanoate) depolymerase family esterase